LNRLLRNIIESCIRNISGGLGRRIRYLYYRKQFNSCGHKINIDENVYFDYPQSISLGNHIWIDRNCIFISSRSGKIEIGDGSHIGIGSILQGHGKIIVGNYFTTSAGCKLYSTSNDPHRCFSGTLHINTSENDLIKNELLIGNNVWLGLNVIMVKGRIEDNVFVKSNSIITGDIPQNSIAEGNPCRKTNERYKNE